MQIDMVVHLEGTNTDVASATDLLNDIAKLTPAYKGCHVHPGKKRLRSVTIAGGWDEWCKKWLPRWKTITCDECDTKYTEA